MSYYYDNDITAEQLSQCGLVYIEHRVDRYIYPMDNSPDVEQHTISLVVAGVPLFADNARKACELCIQLPNRLADTLINGNIRRWYITLEEMAELIEDAWPAGEE